MRARLFAPACSGADGVALLTGLVTHAKNAARESGFDMLVLNLDAEDPLRRALGKPSFFTHFMQKQLQPAARDALPLFDASAFHDPRDL